MGECFFHIVAEPGVMEVEPDFCRTLDGPGFDFRGTANTVTSRFTDSLFRFFGVQTLRFVTTAGFLDNGTGDTRYQCSSFFTGGKVPADHHKRNAVSAAVCRTLGKFTRDEDGIPLLSLRITFAETPLTRYIKIYYTGESPHIQQYERPGGDFILMMTMAMKNELTMAPIIGGTLNKVDNDYIKYRINKRFSPDVSLHASKTIPRRKKLYEEQH